MTPRIIIMDILRKFLRLDRRLLFAAVAVCVIVPTLFPINLRVNASPPTRALFEHIDGLKPGTAVVLSLDYDPATDAELTPMAYALARHCRRRHLPVVFMSLDPGGVGLAVTIADRWARETGAEYGVDYVVLGYKAGIDAVILAFGRDIKLAYPADVNNRPLDQLPLTRRVRTYADIGVVVTLASAGYPELWVPYAHERYGAKIGAGVTAVMAPDYYPYLETGQFVGMLGGLKGAAEYEELIGRPGNGYKGMDAQTMVHLFIVLMILLGNVAYLLTSRRKEKA